MAESRAHDVAPARLRTARAAAIGAAAGACAGGIWLAAVGLFDTHLSFFSMAVGAAVGSVVVRTGGRGVRFQAVSLTTALALILVVEALAMRLLAVRQLSDTGVSDVVPILLPFKVMWDLVAAGITSDPPTVVFFGVSLWFAIALPRRVEPYSGLDPARD